MYLSIYPSVCTFVFYCFILLALYISTKILSYSYGIYSIRKEQKVQNPELRCPYMRQGRGIRGTVIVLSGPLSPESKSLNAFLRTALYCPQVGCPQGSPVVTPVLIFLQCVFSHVSSKCLHRRMHSYTGCICLTQSVSPHCTALSKVVWPQGSPVVTPVLWRSHCVCQPITSIPISITLSTPIPIPITANTINTPSVSTRIIYHGNIVQFLGTVQLSPICCGKFAANIVDKDYVHQR